MKSVCFAAACLIVGLVDVAPAEAQNSMADRLDNSEPGTSSESPTVLSLEEVVADYVHDLVNRERERRGISRVKRNDALDRVATLHSQSMSENSFFDHIDPSGRDATRRSHAAGYLCLADGSPSSVGENLFTGFRYSTYTLTYHSRRVLAKYDWKTAMEIAEEVVEAWIDSPPHLENLLLPHYRSHGIGVYLSQSLEVFVTQNLC